MQNRLAVLPKPGREGAVRSNTGSPNTLSGPDRGECEFSQQVQTFLHLIDHAMNTNVPSLAKTWNRREFLARDFISGAGIWALEPGI
jgi:hypothetical protein